MSADSFVIERFCLNHVLLSVLSDLYEEYYSQSIEEDEDTIYGKHDLF